MEIGFYSTNKLDHRLVEHAVSEIGIKLSPKFKNTKQNVQDNKMIVEK